MREGGNVYPIDRHKYVWILIAWQRDDDNTKGCATVCEMVSDGGDQSYSLLGGDCDGLSQPRGDETD